MFCDASQKAFAAVAYWWFIYLNNKIASSFILAQARVAPSKPNTIPLLKLQTALIAVRLAKTIVKEHNSKIKERYLWSDSKTF